MVKPRIIVNDTTGKTGSLVVAELLKAGCPRPQHDFFVGRVTGSEIRPDEHFI
jgi:hypothetical protein